MTYRQDRENRRRNAKIIFFVTAIFAVFFFERGIFPFFSGVAVHAEPIITKGQDIKDSAATGFWSFFSIKSSLVKENNSLQQKIEEYKTKMLDYDRLFAENIELKSLLGRNEKEKTLLSSVIAGPGHSPYDTILLDVGSDGGVKTGDRVLAYGTVEIGEIREVFKSSSRAVLRSSYGENYDAVVFGKNTPIKLSGRGGGNFVAEMPRGVELNKGDKIYSAGTLPHILGIVEGVFADPRDPFQSVLVRSEINPSMLHFVEIIL